MNNETFNPQDSLKLINSMIDKAKNRLADDGFLLIFWGWLIALCSIVYYLTVRLHQPWGDWIWAILPPAGGIFSMIYSYREKKARKVKTHIDTYLSYLWSGFIISMFITLIFLPSHGIHNTYFSLMILYGLATFMSGGLLNFKPLIAGSIFSFAFAILSVFVGELDQLLCMAGALMCSYIIPGHLLRSKYKSQQDV